MPSTRARMAALVISLLSLLAGSLAVATGATGTTGALGALGATGATGATGVATNLTDHKGGKPPWVKPGGPAGVADRVDLGDTTSEADHGLTTDGPTEPASGTATAGRVTDDYTARQVSDGGRFSVELEAPPGQPLTLQLRELRPDDGWGEAYGYRVYVDDVLVHVRDDATTDAGGGPYQSVFLDTHAKELLRTGNITVTVEGTSDEPAYFTDIWAYADLDRMVADNAMRVPDHLNFLLGQDHLGEAAFRQRLDYVVSNFAATEHVELGFAVLDYPPNRQSAEMAANYQLWAELSREYDLPFVINQHTEWEGTPSRQPDGKGGYFGDLEYQQILWSPQDQTGPDLDVYTNPDGETQRLDELLGEAYEPRYGLSVPNVWGSTPWLTWHHPDLNAYYEQKINESLAEISPLLWDLQRTGEQARLLPSFSTTTESVYWSKRDNIGVWDVVYTDYNGGVERVDLFADLNPYTVAAALEDGVTLEPPTDGDWPAETKEWLYRNQSHHQQLFADILYAGLPRERIAADGDQLDFPDDLLRHNIHSEIYSRMQEPYYSGVFPSSTQGILERARPGAQFITLDNYNPGGFDHLQKMREFGRIANPNLENSVSTHAPDKTLLLRQAFVNGSRFTTPYNWAMGGDDDATAWVMPFLEDLHPWDVVHDADPDGAVTGQPVVEQTFTAGDVRLTNTIDVQLERTGPPAPLRLTLREGDADGRIVGMLYLSAQEVPADGWASFLLPVVQLETGATYHIEIAQEGGEPAYSFPTAGGDLLHRVGVDLLAERDRSLVIQWRRDAADAISHVSADLTEEDIYAEPLLAEARQALAADRYVEAYQLAIQADSMRFPVLFQAAGAATLDPFGLTSDAGFAVDIDVATHLPERRLEYTVTGYEPGQVSFTVAGIPGARVFVDRVEQRPTERGTTGERSGPSTRSEPNGTVSFDVEVFELGSREVIVIAEGEDPPDPFPSDPPIVTGVDTPAPMFGGRDNLVAVTVENTTNEVVDLTAAVDVPDGWSAEPATASVPAQQVAVLEVTVTPPAEPAPVATLAIEVTADGHEVRDGVQEVDVIAVPHGDDIVLALDAGVLTSPVVDSYQQLAPQHFFDPEFRDYGWVGAPPESRDRGGSVDDVRRDFVNDVAPRTVRVTVPAGEHDAYLLVGDASFPSPPTLVRGSDGALLAESEPQEDGEYGWVSFVLDGGPDGAEIDLTFEGTEGEHWRFNALIVG